MRLENKLLSLDVWDTLIRRTTFPDNIKVFAHLRYRMITGGPLLVPNIEILAERQTEERMLARQNKDNGFDLEHPIHEVYERFNTLLPDEISEQIRFELELEKMCTYADKQISAEINKYSGHEKIVVSDFYFSREHLEELVKHHHPDLNLKNFHVSAEYLRNKSGKLFEFLKENYYKNYDGDWTHIGDSLQSDVDGANKNGIKGIHFEPIEAHKVRLKLSENFHQRVELNNLENLYPESQDLGIAIGMIGFAEYIRSRAIINNSLILFLEREGIILEKIFQQVIKENIFNLPAPNFKKLAVSRMAVYAAYAGIDLEGVTAKFQNIYPKAGTFEFLRSLGVPNIEEYSETNSSIDIFLSISKNRDLLLTYCKKQLSNLQRYFREQIEGYENVIVIDVGWMGSIQELLSKIFTNVNIEGIYLGMYPESSLQEIGIATSYLSQSSRYFKKIIHTVRPLEMLFMPPEVGSVTGYSDDGHALRRKKDKSWSPPEAFENKINNIIKSLPAAIDYFKANLITLYEASEILAAAFYEFLSNPDPETLKSYLDSHYDENFGLATNVHIGSVGRTHFFKAMLTLNEKQLRTFWNRVGWHEAAYFQIFRKKQGAISRFILKNFALNVHSIKRWLKSTKKLTKLNLGELYQQRNKFYESVKHQGIRKSIRKSIGFVSYHNFLNHQLVSSARGNAPSTTLLDATSIYVHKNEKIDGTITSQLINYFNSTKLSIVPVPFSKFTEFRNGSISNKIIILDPQLNSANLLQIKLKQARNSYTHEWDAKALISVRPTTKTAAWIINGMPEGSGGHRGMFRMALALQKRGVQTTLYILNTGETEEKLITNFRKHFYDVNVNIKPELTSLINQKLVFATSPATYEIARRIASLNSTILYLVQDDEALFHPVSTTFFKARAHYYDKNVQLVASGVWMKERIKELTGKEVFHFNFPVDNSIYFASEETIATKKPNLLVYFKPEATRRLAELVTEVLSIVRYFLPDLEIKSFGSTMAPPAELGITHLGQLASLDELANLYRESSLALMFSPTNPSLLPYEMGACGLPVVDYIEPSDIAKQKFVRETGIVESAPYPYAIAMKIVELFQSPMMLKDLQRNVLKLAKNHESEETVSQKFADFILFEHFGTK